MTTREAVLARWRTSAYAIWAVIGGMLLLAVAALALARIGGALAPFVIAFLFVFAFQTPVKRLEARGIPRGPAVGLCFLIGFVILTLALVFIVPPIGRQMAEFASAIPGYLTLGRELIDEAQGQFSEIVIPSWLRDVVFSVAQSLSNILVRLGNAIAEGIVSAGGGVATVVFDLFLGVVISFWTLKDLPMIRRELRTLAGDKYEDDLENLLSTIGRMVGGYIKGQTVASVVTGLAAGIGLALIGVPYALVLGIITFVFNYVPYVGPFVAGLVAAVLGLFQGPWVAVGAIVIVVAAQNVTDAVVTPRVMSEQVDLHPTLVIFSLLVGGSLFGFWGMIFSIPIAATAKALFVYYYERRTRRQLATEDGALFRTKQCEEEDSETPCEDDEKMPSNKMAESTKTGTE